MNQNTFTIDPASLPHMDKHGVYSITLPSDTHGEVTYYGSTHQEGGFRGRLNTHAKTARRGVHKNHRVNNSIQKYGPSSAVFRILLVSEPDKETVLAAEQWFLDKYYGTPACLNLHPLAAGGANPAAIEAISKEVRVWLSGQEDPVTYPSAKEASRSLGLANETAMSRILQGNQDLPSGVDWVEYVDDDTEARWCQDRWYRRQRPAGERGLAAQSDAILAHSPEGISLEFESIAAAGRDERVPDPYLVIRRYLTGKTKNTLSGWRYEYKHGSARPRNNGRVVQAVDLGTGEVLVQGNMAEVARRFGLERTTLRNWLIGRRAQPSEQAAQGRAPHPSTANLAGIRFQWAEDN